MDVPESSPGLPADITWEPDVTVVGIGASAGGLGALKSFFASVPDDAGVSFVVIVHFSPEHESHLANLLQPHTSMPVQQVSGVTPLKANQVYVIPPGRNLDAIDTHLRLTDLEEERRERAPIDHFFRTLADTHGGHAIGVILTGTGFDGTLGVQEIKEKGGLTIVQDPAQAEYDGMPQSALATGQIDLVLPIEQMPAAIRRFAQTELRVVVPEDDADIGAQEERRLLQTTFAQVRARTDRDFSRYKRSTIMRRIRRRMQMYHIEELKRYVEEYETSQEEMKATNEELRSSNEELRSTLEELETSKEELQSMNEELQTVNQENRHKVEELAQLAGDLQNLMAATDIATLFLDKRLRILRFTPQVNDLFNLRTADRGRLISDLTHRLGYDELQEDARQVLDSLVPIEREVRDEQGRCYLTRVLPYRSTRDRIEGVAITFVDITERARTEQEFRQGAERLRRVLDIESVGVMFFDEEGTLIDANNAFLRLTGYTRRDIDSGALTWRTMTPDEWMTASEEELEKLAATGKIGPYEKEYLCADGTRIWMRFAGASLDDGTIVEHCIDISDRKEAEQALVELNRTLEEQVDARTRQVRALASELTMAEQEERRRVSQVLHDDLQQLLYGVQMKMTFIRMRAEANDREGLMDDVDEAEAWVRDAIATTRHLTVELSPPVLEGEGLADALQWLRTQMKELHHLDVEIDAAHGYFIADEDMRVLLFQLVRELLFNVVKHADTDRATVALRDDDDDRVVMVVSDRGRGFDPEQMQVEQHGGFGLVRMHERLDIVGGCMDIDAKPGQGTRVTVRVPVDLQRETSGE